ncbi:MAG: M48 family metalloprotease, partial [Lysobacter sp.]
LLDGGPGDDSASTLAIAPFSRRMEAEADYTGLYMAALAGHDLSQAEQVWREMGINVTASSNKTVADTHPSSPERFVAIKRTVAEIQAKQQAGQPLRP